jgi:hypothetical protein
VNPDRRVLLERCRAALQALAATNDPREQLIAKLDLMAERLRASPDWVEPSPAEQEHSRQQLNRWFRQRGFDIEL